MMDDLYSIETFDHFPVQFTPSRGSILQRHFPHSRLSRADSNPCVSSRATSNLSLPSRVAVASKPISHNSHSCRVPSGATLLIANLSCNYDQARSCLRQYSCAVFTSYCQPSTSAHRPSRHHLTRFGCFGYSPKPLLKRKEYGLLFSRGAALDIMSCWVIYPPKRA